MTHHTGTLWIGDDGYEATYRISAWWDQGDVFSDGVTLISWVDADGANRTKADAVTRFGADDVERNEANACEAWLDTALRDMADARADMRAAIAAE